MFFEKVSVVKPPAEYNEYFEEAVQQIQMLKKEGLSTSDIESNIDNMLYKIYNLNQAEITIIESVTN